MSSFPRKVFHENYVFEVAKGVYTPAEDSFLLAENLIFNNDDLVMDVGTGCGIIAVVAAKKAKKVIATDINPLAVQCARQNAILNNVGNKVEVRYGDLFDPLNPGEKFNGIFFNAPYLPSEPWEELDLASQAWAGGKTGRNTIDRFIREAPGCSSDEGRILLVQSTLSDVEKSLQMFAEQGLVACVIAEKKLDFETIVVLEARLEHCKSG